MEPKNRVDELNGVMLFDHQWEAYNRFKDSDEAALFFEMGCGKSLTTLALAGHKFIAGEIDSLLVIAPNDVHKQWATEQCQWFKDTLLINGEQHTGMNIQYHVQCIGGRGGAKQLYPFQADGKLHIVCVNVDTFSTPHKWEQIVRWCTEKTMIVLDEATAIKTYKSQRTQRIIYAFNIVSRRGTRILSSVKKSKARAVLTGTPVTNGPMDLWSIMEFVKPNFFGREWYSFRGYYGMYTKLAVGMGSTARSVDVPLTEKTWKGIKDCTDYNMAYALFGCSQDTFLTIHSQDHFAGPYKHADELKGKLNSVAMFCKLIDCVDMPQQNYITQRLTMSPDIAGCYKSMKKEQNVLYNDHLATAKTKLAAATRLQQISSGFIYGKNVNPEEMDEEMDILPDEVTWIGNSNPKMEAVKRDVDESDKPIIILTRYTAEASRLFDEFSDKYSTLLYTGWKKTGNLDDFKAGKYDVLIANTACIARGFNLQNAHTTLFYSNTFSMELRQQAEFRTFRIGQKENCKYVDYIYDDTVDVDIVKALGRKKDMLEYFRTEEK